MSKGFKGSYSHSIDARGRIIIPSELRERLGEKFVITTGFDSCLYVYPEDEWENIENRCREISLTAKEARRFARFFIGNARDCEIDKQGRVLIKPGLREYAGIKEEVELVGMLDRIEIWDKERWQQENDEYVEANDTDEMAEYMAGLGLRI